jgi:hypothetical protein
VQFDPRDTAARLRVAGVTPSQMVAALNPLERKRARDEDFSGTSWAERRRQENIVIAPLEQRFNEAVNQSVSDSAACPEMTALVRRLANLRFPTTRMPGVTAQPPLSPSIPRDDDYRFEILAGESMMRWEAYNAPTAIGRDKLTLLDRIDGHCNGRRG